MKYSFDVPEITDCYQCPCYHRYGTGWEAYCNLYYVLNQKIKKISDRTPDWCLLKTIKNVEKPMSGITTKSIPIKYEVHIDSKTIRKIAGKKL